MGTTLEALVFEHGRGMLQGRDFKAVFTGGPSNTLLTKRDLDVPLDFDSVRARQSRLGTGAMIVISEGHQHRPQGRGVRRLLRERLLRAVPAMQGRHVPDVAPAQPDRYRAEAFGATWKPCAISAASCRAAAAAA